MSQVNSDKKITSKNGTCFPQKNGQSILDASIEAGFPIPHSCRSGRCGFCKAKVIAGKTVAYRREALSSKDLNDNWILTCARTATTNIEIDIATLNRIDVPKVVTIPCVISGLSLQSQNVIKVVLQLPLAVRFDFLAGQYIDITNVDGVSRSYSITSSKVNNQTIELHIRKIEQGLMSDYWFNRAKVNDLLTLQGPKGSCFLRDVTQKHLVFIATSAGIAPIQGMLESNQNLPITQQAQSITIIWGGNKTDAFYLDIQPITNGTTFLTVLLDNDKYWQADFGELHDVLLNLQSNMRDTRVYAFGSPYIINQMKLAFTNQGLSPKYFFAEAFYAAIN